MADTWDYDVFTMLAPRTADGILNTRAALNAHAANGWELVSTAQGCDGWIVYYMKRLAPPEDVFGDNAWSAASERPPAAGGRGADPQAP
jgi:hypothetical protein